MQRPPFENGSEITPCQTACLKKSRRVNPYWYIFSRFTYHNTDHTMSLPVVRSDQKKFITLLVLLFLVGCPAERLRASDRGEMAIEISLEDTILQTEESTLGTEASREETNALADSEKIPGPDSVMADGDPEAALPASAETHVDSVLSVTASAARRQTIPFFRRWWFSLLVILLAAPFVYRLLNRRLGAQEKLISEHTDKIEGLTRLLAQKDEVIAKKESEFHERLVEEEELKYHAVGLSKFSEIMSGSKEELEKLGQHIIYELVKYLGVNMGAIYIAKGENTDDQVLELLSAYAPDARQLQAKIHPGEGFVGTCYNEGQVMAITDVPTSYTKISSGLGEANPSYLAFIPLLQDESKLGVIELASFKNLEKHKLEFMQKLAQNIASFIAIRTAAARVQEMLARSQSQAEELQAQEEELRQNLEEMQATQEELNRQMQKNLLIQEDLAKEKYLMDALMNHFPDSIYFKDLDSKFLKSSQSLARSFGFSSADALVGKSDFDFFNEEHARPAYEDEQKIIKTGKPIINLVEKEVRKDGSVAWVSTTKMPLLDQKGKVVGTFGISKDITEAKKMEIELQQRNEEMKAQEEELRQNLEEMQSVQEEMERQKAELDWEKHLMDTLLNNLPEYIYFKDKDSKFIKNSLSHARLFGASDPKEIMGKSDFDFFAEEHARPAFEDEQKIIKTGKSIINLVEKEVKKDGSMSWVSTSKMPLYDKQGKIIGTFGISKDITATKKMEMEIQQRNKELQAQEEELRQNLEEMQSIQEDLHRRMQENEKMKSDYQKKEKELLRKIEELKKK